MRDISQEVPAICFKALEVFDCCLLDFDPLSYLKTHIIQNTICHIFFIGFVLADTYLVVMDNFVDKFDPPVDKFIQKVQTDDIGCDPYKYKQNYPDKSVNANKMEDVEK